VETVARRKFACDGEHGTETIVEGGTEIFIPLNKLKKSPKNARKTPHSEAAIKAYAVSITAKGILHLVVEPELDADGAATGFYFVTIGEGRRDWARPWSRQAPAADAFAAVSSALHGDARGAIPSDIPRVCVQHLRRQSASASARTCSH
jgi:hypothetical protein